MVSYRHRAIREIEGVLQTAEAIMTGELPLARLNAGIPDEERYQTPLDAAQPLAVKVHHWIDFACQLGILDRNEDKELLASFDRRLRAI